MTRRLAAVALAVAASTSVACGKKREDKPAAAPPPAPIGLPAQAPLPPPALKVMPTFVTMAELEAHAPALPAVRLTTAVTLDPSGKQALGEGCVTATEPKLAMHQIADAYGVARWDVRSRQTSDGDRRAELRGEYAVHDGVINVRGVLSATGPAPCREGEVALSLQYTKVVKAPRVAPPGPGSDVGAGRVPAAP